MELELIGELQRHSLLQLLYKMAIMLESQDKMLKGEPFHIDMHMYSTKMRWDTIILSIKSLARVKEVGNSLPLIPICLSSLSWDTS
jgi:hypothetical protein